MIKEKFIRAYEYAKQKHEGQKRKYVDLDYFTHPKWVARLIEEFEDEDMACAAILHDVLEDTNATYEEIKMLFGDDVANLVLELTSDKTEVKRLGKAIYLARKIVALSDRAFIIKCADRIHNLLFAETDSADYSFIKKYYNETMVLLKVFELREEQPSEYKESIHKYVGMLKTVLEFYRIRYNDFRR